MQQLPLGVALKTEADLEDYVAGPNLEAATAVAEWAAGGEDTFLYLSGPPGTGKTHLLQAACRHAADRSETVFYLPLAEPDLMPTVLEGLERRDLVALDDLQSVVGQRKWELAIFGLYNRLRETGRRLLVSADAPRTELPIALADLRSRLGWGPGYRLRPLGESDCEHLLLRAASRRGLRLGEDAAGYIMRRCRREPRELLALLDRLDRASLTRKRRPTVNLIREVLQSPLEEE
jgi:DnaA family protein